VNVVAGGNVYSGYVRNRSGRDAGDALGGDAGIGAGVPLPGGLAVRGSSF